MPYGTRSVFGEDTIVSFHRIKGASLLFVFYGAVHAHLRVSLAAELSSVTSSAESSSHVSLTGSSEV